MCVCACVRAGACVRACVRACDHVVIKNKRVGLLFWATTSRASASQMGVDTRDGNVFDDLDQAKDGQMSTSENPARILDEIVYLVQR